MAEVDRFEEALFGVVAAPEQETEQETRRRLLIRVIAAKRSAQAREPLRLAVAPAKRGGHARLS
jgi:hypothetical protein